MLMGLQQGLLDQILKLLSGCQEVEKLVLYESRARGNFTATSDIDLAIFAKGWHDRELNLLKHSLNEFVKTPLKIDKVDSKRPRNRGEHPSACD